METNQTVRSQLTHFFFDRRIPYGMALTRVGMSLLMLVVMGRRWPRVREFFSTDGATAQLSKMYGQYNLLPELPAEAAVALYTLLLCSLLTLCIGWKTKLSSIICFVLFTYFTMLDGVSTMTKHSVLASHTFFLLMLSECGAVWSVDQWLVNKKSGMSGVWSTWGAGRRVEIWPQRLLQLFIGIVYFGAAVTKMHTPEYFSGDQLRFWMLTEVNHYNPVGEVMALFPALMVLFGYIAIIWEVMFIFLVWNRIGRWWMLGLGALFHFMTTLSLGLYVFPLVCYSIYLCFISEEDVIWLSQRLGKTSRRFISGFTSLFETIAGPTTQLGQAGLGVAVVLTMAGAVWLESSLDVYGEHRSEGPHTLEEISPQLAEQLLNSNESVQERDKLLTLDIGHLLVGGIVADYQTTFHQNDHLYVQANLVPPHGDLWLECNLHDEQGRILDRVSQVVSREEFRSTFCYTFTEAQQPGIYQLVLRSNGVEIARRHIKLLD